MSEKGFTGPLGIWRWPILRLLLGLIGSRGGSHATNLEFKGRMLQGPSLRLGNIQVDSLEHWKVLKDSAGDITDVIVKRGLIDA